MSRPLAILVGFRYRGAKELTSAPLDIQLMIKHLATFDFDCVVISDFIPEISVEFYPFVDLKDLIFLLENFLEMSREILFYYSGHASDNNLHLPDNTLLSSKVLTQVFKQRLDSQARVLTIFDCCYGVVLDLPFTLSSGKMKVTDGVFMTPMIISINETDKDLRAEMRKSGSRFTNVIITWDLRRLLRLDYLPARTIKSSYPSLSFLLASCKY